MEYTLKYLKYYLTHNTLTIRHFKAKNDNEAVRKIIKNMRVGFYEDNLNTWIEEGTLNNNPKSICSKIENTKYLQNFYFSNDSSGEVIWDTYEGDIDEQYVSW